MPEDFACNWCYIFRIPWIQEKFPITLLENLFTHMNLAAGTREEPRKLTENRDGKCDVKLLAFTSLSRSQMPHIEQSVYTIWRQNLHNKTSLLL